jgi:hypothetical protein
LPSFFPKFGTGVKFPYINTLSTIIWKQKHQNINDNLKKRKIKID